MCRLHKNHIENRFLSRHSLLALLVITAITIPFPYPVIAESDQQSVTLVSFEAESLSGIVNLRWETATELDNAGFFILRSTEQNSGFVRISYFIESLSDGITGAIYTYSDFNVTNGVSYWYKLEAIDYSQFSFIYEPPILAIPGVVMTPTPTRTVTSVITPSITSPTPTATSIPTLFVGTPSPTTVLGYPGPATATQSAQLQAITSTPTAGTTPFSTDSLPTAELGIITGTLQGTATLIPVPMITMVFPQVTVVASSAQLETNNGPRNDNRPSWFTLERIIFLGFILLIWLLLGGWYFLTMRRLE